VTIIRYDDGPAHRIQALSDTPEMGTQRRRVLDWLAPRMGERILDVGCGPGHLVSEIGQLVGQGGRAVGVDVSAQMLMLAERRGVEVVQVHDTSLPFDDGAFDAATATQVYEFVEDLPNSLAELHRVLRPGGRALILDTDWDSIVWHSSDDDRMRRVLDGWRRRTANPHLPRTLAPRLRRAGFRVIHRETFTIFDATGDEASYSAHQIDHLGASAVGVPEGEIKAWSEDLRALAQSGEYFFSLNRYLFLATRPAASP
jgi:ubiquinone/menaquinone biosynthesis C-methylase UbiE